MTDFDDSDTARLLGDSSIVRSRAKIQATIRNTAAYVRMLNGKEDFSLFTWSHVGNTPLLSDGSGTTNRSSADDILSVVLKQRGFSFVGR